MFLFILSTVINGNHCNNKLFINFKYIIILTSLFYIILIHYNYNKYFTILIPLDFFLTNIIFYKNNKNIIKSNNIKKKPVLDNFIKNNISLNDTLIHTLENIKVN